MAITIGLVILLGYFIESPLVQNLRFFLLEWAIILASVAGLVTGYIAIGGTLLFFVFYILMFAVTAVMNC